MHIERSAHRTNRFGPGLSHRHEHTMNCADSAHMHSSAFHGSGHAFHITSLGQQEHQGNGNGNQDTARVELGVIVVHILLLQHGPQTDGDGIVLRVVAHDNLRENVIHPGTHEGCQQSIGNNGFGQRYGNLDKCIPFGSSVNISRFVNRPGYGIEEALGHIEAKSRASRIHQYQRQLLQGTCLQQSQTFQDVIHRNHGHEAREHSQYHGNAHEILAHLKAQAAHDIGYAQHEECGQQGTENGDHQGIKEPSGEVDIGTAGNLAVDTHDQFLVIIQGKPLGPDIGLVGAALLAE